MQRRPPGLLWGLLTLVTATALAVAPENNLSEASLARVRRQALTTPQLWPGPPGKLNVPIPTNIAIFGGSSQPIDNCPRDEVTMEDGSCQQLLTQGNCGDDEYVLLNPENDRGYCAPRLCPPDRVFIFSTQLCHDPQDPGICPPGRELYISSYGTPVCSCPDGTYEGDDDLDDDVCEPILGQILNCPPNQVFWFRDLNAGPMCVPDPCDGLNLNRGPNDLPFLPSLMNGKCFQMGSSSGVCPPDTWYGLSLDTLKGVCATLEEFGYNVFNSSTLNGLLTNLGSPITENNLALAPVQSHGQQQGGVNNNINQPFIGSAPNQNNNDQNIINQNGNGFQQTSAQQQGQSSPSNGNSQPIQAINQIQQQIGALQQQLQKLQESLGQTGQTGQTTQISSGQVPQPQQISGNTNSQIQATTQETNTISNELDRSIRFSSRRGSSSSNSNSITRSPLILKATLESQFSTDSPNINVRTTSRGRIVPSRGGFTPSSNSQRFLPSRTTFRNDQQVSPNVAPFQNRRNSQRVTPVRDSNSGFSRDDSFNQNNFNQGNSFRSTSAGQNRRQGLTSQNQDSFRPSRRQNANPNLQIQLEPLEFVQFQNPSRRRQQQLNSIEQPGGQQQSFEQFGGGFFQSQPMFGRRKKRSPQRFGSNRPRRRRSPLPHASPSNVFESRLLGCRGGAIRDINAKCRNVILPSRIPKRPVRAAPPIKPRRPCSGAFNIFRICVSSSSSAQASINAFALG